MKDYFKYDEIKSYFNDFLAEDSGIDGERNDFLATHDSDFRDELHHHAFNTDYFIIGTYKAKQWLGDKAFDAIDIIEDILMRCGSHAAMRRTVLIWSMWSES